MNTTELHNLMCYWNGRLDGLTVARQISDSDEFEKHRKDAKEQCDIIREKFFASLGRKQK